MGKKRCHKHKTVSCMLCRLYHFLSLFLYKKRQIERKQWNYWKHAVLEKLSICIWIMNTLTKSFSGCCLLALEHFEQSFTFLPLRFNSCFNLSSSSQNPILRSPLPLSSISLYPFLSLGFFHFIPSPVYSWLSSLRLIVYSEIKHWPSLSIYTTE